MCTPDHPVIRVLVVMRIVRSSMVWLVGKPPCVFIAKVQNAIPTVVVKRNIFNTKHLAILRAAVSDSRNLVAVA
jgi:hypothetical protein